MFNEYKGRDMCFYRHGVEQNFKVHIFNCSFEFKVYTSTQRKTHLFYIINEFSTQNNRWFYMMGL